MATINKADLMRILHQDLDDDEPVRPLVEAQVMELKSRFADYHQKGAARLLPGNVVVEKPGMVRLNRDNVVLMLWRVLDETNWQDRIMVEHWLQHFPHDRVDCVVAYTTDDGKGLQFMLFDSRTLRRA